MKPFNGFKYFCISKVLWRMSALMKGYLLFNVERQCNLMAIRCSFNQLENLV